MSDNSGSNPAAPSPVSSDSQTVESVDTSSDSIEVGGEETHGHDSIEDIESDPNLSKQEKKEAKKALKELEIKYNGKSEKVKLPFDIPEEQADWMRRQLQMAKMGQHKAQDYAALERDVLSFMNELKANPRKALSNPAYGVDLKKIAVEMIEEEIANSQKSPEEIEREEYKRKLAEYEEKEAARQKEMEEMKKQKIVDEAYAQYDAAMSNAMDQYNIPKTPIAVYEMAHLMSLEIKRGYEPDMDAIAQMVEEKLNGDYTKHLRSLPHDKLVKLLGEDIFERDRKARVSKMKKAPVTAKTAVKDVSKVEQKKEEPKKVLTYRERFGI